MDTTRRAPPLASRLAGAAALAALCLWCVGAPAQPIAELPPDPGEADEAARDAEARRQAQQQVDEWAQRAQAAYDAERYEEAIEYFLRVHQAVPTAATVYNIAFIYDRRLGELELARTFYRQYITAPDAQPEAVSRATTRVREINERLEARRQAPTTAGVPALPRAPVGASADASARASDPAKQTASDTALDLNATRPYPPSPSMSRTELAGWITGGLGVAMVGAGAVLGLAAQRSHGDFREASGVDDKQRLRTRGRSQALAADVLYGVGGAAVVAGVVMLVWPDSSPPPVAVGISPGGASVSWAF